MSYFASSTRPQKSEGPVRTRHTFVGGAGAFPAAIGQLRVAWRLLHNGTMTRWWLALVLAVASAPAWAQSAAPPPAAVTLRVQSQTGTAARRVADLVRRRNLLAGQYAQQVAAVERLKQQRTSWRQQRELRDRLAEARDTATKLTAVTAELTRANTALATVRRALVTAIDAELAAGAGGPRAAELARLRAQHAPQVPRRTVQRIVLPELEIDPLADPEELDQQAAALRESEHQLQQQIAGLEKQARDLDAVAKLKQQHDRASDLARRDDDQPQRVALHGGTRLASEDALSPAPQNGGSGGGEETHGFSSSGGFESDVSIVLSEVVDAGTIDTLARAQRSGDPAQRAAAAKKTRDAVAGRLEQLRKKRAEIEALLRARKQRR